MAHSRRIETIRVDLEAEWTEWGKLLGYLENEVAYPHLNVPGTVRRTRNGRRAVWGRLDITATILLPSTFSS